jgi:hypothetical protein
MNNEGSIGTSRVMEVSSRQDHAFETRSCVGDHPERLDHSILRGATDGQKVKHRELDSNQRPSDPRERVLGS